MRFFENEKSLVILDVDGVILDVRYFEFHFVDVAQDHHLPVDRFLKHWKNIEEGVEQPLLDLNSALKAFWGIEDRELVNSFVRGLVEKEINDPYPPVWRSVEAIASFRDHGLSVALCTSRPGEILEKVLGWIGMKMDWFAAVSARECGYSKPDPRIFAPIFKEVKVPKDQIIYVGDFGADFEAARAADIDFAAVLSGLVPRSSFIAAGVPSQCIFDNLFQVQKSMADSRTWGGTSGDSV